MYFPPKNLLEQMSADAVKSLALLLGCSGGNLSGLRSVLEKIPCLPAEFTVGDAMRAYLRAQLAYFDSLAG